MANTYSSYDPYDYDTYSNYNTYGGYSNYNTYGGYDYYSNPYATSPKAMDSQAGGIIATVLGIGIFMWIFIIAVCILTYIGLWKSFTKAGHAGWESLIPGHNEFTMFEDSGIKGYWFFLFFVPIARVVVTFWLNIEYAKSFGKTAGFGVGLTLLPFVFFPILGLGKSQYIGPAYQPNNNQPNYNNQQNNQSNMNNINTQQSINNMNVQPNINAQQSNSQVDNNQQVTNANQENTPKDDNNQNG